MRQINLYTERLHMIEKCHCPALKGPREAAVSKLTHRVAMASGEPFTRSTLQRGRMIQNVVPFEGEE
ncbi:hypothetical protein GCM10009560_36750 [Nonomuraea longicatena]|uniref:Uncharacterized protein n=1 Tax=Nonomuraea longicatena TaxID=83682 RepID=A0ABP4A4P5_9ACTN